MGVGDRFFEGCTLLVQASLPISPGQLFSGLRRLREVGGFAP